MMVNCPKCGFLQDKDTYCARCGVNMETYQPPQIPLWKQIIGNWAFQLAVLFIAIFITVIWDNISGSPRQQAGLGLPPVSDEFARTQVESSSAPVQEDMALEKEIEIPTEPSQQPAKAEPQAEQETAVDPFLKKVSMRVVSLNRSSIDSLSRVSRRIDDNAFVLNRDQLRQFISENPDAVSGFGTTRNGFSPGQISELFLGEEDLVSSKTYGFFSQVTVLEGSQANSIRGELRFWSQLRQGDDGSASIVLDFNVKSRDTIVVIDPSFVDIEFTNEELSLFESSDKFQGLNDELFVENDIALFLELR